MRKRLFVLGALLSLCLTMAGCADTGTVGDAPDLSGIQLERLTPADHSDLATDDGVYLAADGDSFQADTEYIFFYLENHTDRTIEYDHATTPEVLVNGTWYEIPLQPWVSYTLDRLLIEPGEQRPMTIMPDSCDYDFLPGTYRACVKYRFAGDPGTWDHVAVAEFEITASAP